MRCLILCSKRYSINNSLIQGLKSKGIEIQDIDYEDYFLKSTNSFIKKFESLPIKIKNSWKKRYVKKVNSYYKSTFEMFKPDLIIIYNNQNILPEVLEDFKKAAKIVFILGDHPLYTPTNIYNLHILFYANYIICPDTFWVKQLTSIGLKNVVFDSFTSDSQTYFSFKPNISQIEEFGSDFVYVGSAHKNNWGYKRFLFLNQFRKFNFKVYISGDGFKNRWGKFYPELEPLITEHKIYDPSFNNLIYNCSKISPVDMVPSLFNGIHVRVWDILGAGIFPFCEYSEDLDRVFKSISIPFITNYNKAADLAGYLLKNENERLDLVRQMQNVVFDRFSPDKTISRMLEYLESNK